MSRKDWNKYLEYDETSPSCLRWKVEIRTGKNYNRVLVSPGDEAGCFPGGDCYWTVRLDNKSYTVHTVIYEMFFGPIPKGKVIDHINGIKTDNRVSNLRVVDRRTNQRNMKQPSTNTTGATGVSFNMVNNGRNGRYRATYVDEFGITHGKNFSVKKCGSKEEALNLACKWRKDMIEESNNRGAGYSDRHGEKVCNE